MTFRLFSASGLVQGVLVCVLLRGSGCRCGLGVGVSVCVCCTDTVASASGERKALSWNRHSDAAGKRLDPSALPPKSGRRLVHVLPTLSGSLSITSVRV